jgi:D-ribose pyranase
MQKGQHMKRIGILNGPLSAAIAQLGHTDGLVVCDAGLPIPPGPERIDLALVPGTPGFLEVVRAIAGEMMIERALVATEMATASAALRQALDALLSQIGGLQGSPIAIDICPHEEFKSRTRHARAVVRTGECTPYANVILYSGVAFRRQG